MRDAGFCLYQRNRKKDKPLYYAKFKLAGGKWSSGKSTGQTNREAAERWAREQIDSGAVETQAGPEPTMDQWAAGFFGVGGRYDQAKRARGRQLSSTYLYLLDTAYRKRIQPKFGTRKLRDITALELEDFFIDMYQNSGLSGSTVNSALKVVRALFAEAERLGVMYRNPAAKVACFARNGRERGVLTQEELDDLFALDALETVWKGRRVPYLVAMLAVGCGARHGEAVALRAADVGGQTICITRSWNEHAGEFTLPKWKSLREVPAPPRLQAELEQYIHDNNIAGEQLLFPGVDPSRPVDNKKLLDSLRGALAEIGIPPAEQARTRRFLDMHALRHTYVTRLRAGDVPDWQIQRAAGHRSVTMTDRYTHANAGDLKAVAGANILPFKKENVS